MGWMTSDAAEPPPLDGFPPGPLHLRVEAIPENLATVRARLRQWFPAARVDPDTAADLLLAVGEAASNAAEHAPIGARHRVMLTVTASITAAGVRLVVSDDGCWREPPESPGTRGHGLRLIAALVDTMRLTPSRQGSTVDMTKESTR